MKKTPEERALELIKAYVAIIIRLREGKGSFETVHTTLRYDATYVFVEALASMGLKSTTDREHVRYAIRFTRGGHYTGALELAEAIFNEENPMPKNKNLDLAEQIRKLYCVNYSDDGIGCSYMNDGELDIAITKIPGYSAMFKSKPSDLAIKLQSASLEAKSAVSGGGKDKADVLRRWADVLAFEIVDSDNALSKAEAEEIAENALREYRALAGGAMPEAALAKKAFLMALGHVKGPKVTLGSLNFRAYAGIYVDGVHHEINLDCGSTHNEHGTGWAWIVENLGRPDVEDTDAFREKVSSAFAETVKAHIPKQILSAVKEVTRA